MISTKFTVQEHYRKKKHKSHYDFRLVVGRKVYSWALPKERFPKSGERLLAVWVDDTHDMSYITFSGVLDNGDEVTLLDEGDCKIYTIKKQRITFELFGDRFEGMYHLIHTNGDNWIILKGK